MSFDNFLANIRMMFTWFSENVEIINNSQNIRLLLQKFWNPIMTQIKALLQVSYDLYQANTVTYDFIDNSMASEAASLGDCTPWGIRYVNTRGKKVTESSVKGAGGAIFNRFYPNWYKLSDGENQYIFDEMEKLNIKIGGKRKSVCRGKQSRSASIKSKQKAAQKI